MRNEIQTGLPQAPHPACQACQAKKVGDELRSLDSQIFNECARSARLRASEHNAQSSEEDRAVGRGANRNRLVLKTDN
jgi:hypothetical protein